MIASRGARATKELCRQTVHVRAASQIGAGHVLPDIAIATDALKMAVRKTPLSQPPQRAPSGKEGSGCLVLAHWRPLPVDKDPTKIRLLCRCESRSAERPSQEESALLRIAVPRAATATTSEVIHIKNLSECSRDKSQLLRNLTRWKHGCL